MAQPSPDLLAALARTLGAEQDVDTVLGRVVESAVAQIDGAEYAGITSINRRTVATPAASSDLVRVIDHLQYTAGEGPCLTAATDHEHVVTAHDLVDDSRWPHFSAKAVEHGIRSMMSFQLYTAAGDDKDTIGALNVYAGKPDAFTKDSIHTGMLLAAHAAVAAAAAYKTANLHVALQSRDVIGQAKGILMERFRLTADQAFDLLVTASQRTHKKLRDVADLLTATGELVTD